MLESHSLAASIVIGILWTGLGLGSFYIGLIWINTLLGFILTPLFVLPATWLFGPKTTESRKRRS